VIRPVPKPVRAPKRKPQPLRRGKPLERSWMRKGAKKTKHSRRPREFGFISFCHARGCELALDRDTQRILGIVHDCAFERVEFAHLGDKRRYEVGDIGACLCVTVHRGIDGRLGGKLSWYVELGRAGQHLIRMRFANRARAAWDALTPAERERWEEVARARLSSLRAPRRR